MSYSSILGRGEADIQVGKLNRLLSDQECKELGVIDGRGG